MEKPLNNSNTFDICFLTVENVISHHETIIKREGGAAGILDYGLLESAVMSPQSGVGMVYLNPTIFHMAACYLIGISKNHAFKDGNKRTAVMSAGCFLRCNGHLLTLTEEELTQLVLDAVENRKNKEEVAEYFKANTVPFMLPNEECEQKSVG